MKAVIYSLTFLAILSTTSLAVLHAAQEPQVNAATEVSGASDNNGTFLQRIFSKDTNIILVITLAFLYGVFISFTPCVYPMIPITAAILQAQATTSGLMNFFLSLSYILGISFTYAFLGMFVAMAGGIFGAWLGNIWFIAFIVFFFLYLAFAMFGFYEIYIPPFLRRREMVKTQGSLIYSFLAGILAGTVASPCLTPALATMLVYVATLGNPVTGFITLFSFSLGMSTLLLIVGTSSAALALLPHSGVWLVEIKRVFGFLLLGVCLYFIQFKFSYETVLLLTSALILSAALFYIISGQQERKQCELMRAGGKQVPFCAGDLKMAFGFILLLVALLILAEAFLSAQNLSLIKFSKNLLKFT